MTYTAKRYAFCKLQEVFNYILHGIPAVAKWKALLVVVEAQSQVIAS